VRILATGTAGFLGRAAWRCLNEAGHTVIGVDKQPPPEDETGAVCMDLGRPDGLSGRMRHCEAVIHLANHTRPGSLSDAQLYRKNVAINANVFQAAVDAGVRQIIFASSVQVFASDRYAETATAEKPSCLSYLPLDGQEPPCPGNAYAASKEAGETLLRYYARKMPGLAAVSVRWPLIADERKLAFYREHRPAEAPESGSMLDVGCTFLAVTDAADFLRALLAHPCPGYGQFLPAAEENRLGWSAERIRERFYPGVPLRKPLGEGAAALVDPTPIRKQLDWRPTHSSLGNPS